MTIPPTKSGKGKRHPAKYVLGRGRPRIYFSGSRTAEVDVAPGEDRELEQEIPEHQVVGDRRREGQDQVEVPLEGRRVEGSGAPAEDVVRIGADIVWEIGAQGRRRGRGRGHVVRHV